MNLVPKRFFIDDFFNDLIIRENNDLRCDIYEQDGKYHIELDAPGVKKEDMKIEYNKGYLTIAISQKEEKVDESKNYIRKERYARDYSRQFYLGDIDADKIEASFKDGSIKITAPKVDEEAGKKLIEVK